MTAKAHVTREHAAKLLREMIRIRRFEEKCAELYTQEKIRGFLHLYIGEEAIAAGVMQALEAADSVVATYREHGHAIARGIPMDALMAEMYGRREGCSGGRGGSMHVFDAATRFYGGNAIVGGERMSDRPGLCACFFGEGAVAEGAFHESMNLAALWRLPVLFVCENNLYAMGTALAVSESETDLARKAQGYRVAAESVDGMNVVEVEAAARRACEAMRAGGGPQFLECRTYRFRAHSMFDAQLYRDKAEVEQWRKRCPIDRFAAWCREIGTLHDADISAIEAAVAEEVTHAVAFAETGTWEPVEELMRDVYARGSTAA